MSAWTCSCGYQNSKYGTWCYSCKQKRPVMEERVTMGSDSDVQTPFVCKVCRGTPPNKSLNNPCPHAAEILPLMKDRDDWKDKADELASAVEDGLRRHDAGDTLAIKSNMISATLAAVRK